MKVLEPTKSPRPWRPEEQAPAAPQQHAESSGASGKNISTSRASEPPAGGTPTSRIPQKAAGKDLRPQYRLTIQVGLIGALLIVIGLLHLPIRPDSSFEAITVEQDIVQMEEILQTKQEIKPPPPPPPQVPVAVADDAIIDDIELNLDATFEISEALPSLPPPPPTSDEPEAEPEEEEPEVFIAVEQMPELIGGLATLQELITYPKLAQRAGVEGRVFVQFIVDEEGRVLDPVVVRGIGAGCDEEALRAVQQLRFKPGRQRGKPVRVRFSLPVNFQLKEAKM